MTDDPKPKLSNDTVDALKWAAASFIDTRVRNPGDAHEDHTPPKISTTVPHYVTEADKLRAISPEAAKFYNVLREKGLLYPDGTAKPAIRVPDDDDPKAKAWREKVLSMSPLEFATMLDHGAVVRAKAQREEWERRAALLTPDQVCHNLAHAFTLLAAAWLCECPQPHKAVTAAGMWNDPDPLARDMRIKRAQNVERQMQEPPSGEAPREFKRELQGEWPRSEESVLGGRSFAAKPVETLRTKW